ncbi:hypothetical protein [Aeromonas enteropelogenes]|uniref:hypothetical protein n=1 Tax=Aeromonas enteropelogenes TaxID=29489 RepID=UPI003BA194D6
MKHWSLLLLPLALASLPSQANLLSSGCSAKDVAIGSAVNSATGVNSRCSAASTKQRVENAIENPGDYAKRKAAEATGVDEAYNKARNTKQRVENAVENPGDYAKRKAAEAVGVDEAYNRARNTKQRVENAVENPGDYAKRKAAEAVGVDEAYHKARNVKERVDNVVDDPLKAAGKAVLRHTGTY